MTSIVMCAQFGSVYRTKFVHTDGLMQGWGNAIAYKLELPQSCTTLVSWTAEHIETEEYLGKFTEKLIVAH